MPSNPLHRDILPCDLIKDYKPEFVHIDMYITISKTLKPELLCEFHLMILISFTINNGLAYAMLHHYTGATWANFQPTWS